jgi:GxxExxY protein
VTSGLGGEKNMKPPPAYASLSAQEEEIAKSIVDSAYEIHVALGPGLLESVYEICLAHVLTKRGYAVRRQVVVPVVFDTIKFDEGFRLDLIVDDSVICELKAVEKIMPVHKAQLLTYLKLTDKRLGFLINFNVPLIKNGIHRLIK